MGDQKTEANLPEAWRPLWPEIATYYRELPRLLEEDQEGRVVLIKGDQVLSVWDTSADAYQAGVERFGDGVPFLSQPIDHRWLDWLAPYFPAAVKGAAG